MLETNATYILDRPRIAKTQTNTKQNRKQPKSHFNGLTGVRFDIAIQLIKFDRSGPIKPRFCPHFNLLLVFSFHSNEKK